MVGTGSYWPHIRGPASLHKAGPLWPLVAVPPTLGVMAAGSEPSWRWLGEGNRSGQQETLDVGVRFGHLRREKLQCEPPPPWGRVGRSKLGPGTAWPLDFCMVLRVLFP